MGHVHLFLHPCPYLHSQWDVQHLHRGHSEAGLGQQSAPPAPLLLPARGWTHRVHPSDDLFKLVRPSHQSTASTLGKERWHHQDFLLPCIEKSSHLLKGIQLKLPRLGVFFVAVFPFSFFPPQFCLLLKSAVHK